MTAERSALVTGANGFIGRHLAAHLANEGWSVTCLGRRDPHVPGTSFCPVAALTDAEFETAVADRRAAVVFHLAAYGVAPGQDDPRVAFDVNVAGTAAVVRMAARVKAQTIVYAGSCSEYSEEGFGTRLSEAHNLSARTIYGASKAAGGLFGQALATRLGIGFTWMRLFGVYGPGEAAHRLIPSIATSLARGESVALSPGDQIRDFTHVSDVVDGLRRAAETAQAARAATYNLCSGQGVTIRAMAELVADAMARSRSLLRFGAIPRRPGETMWMVGCPESFRKATGFRPRLSLEDGIAATLRSMMSPARELHS
jgi:nucleoside-diphosphate-sugar epimerase